jgi:nitrite reductase (NADH) small subunit/3-phenylpropionate/trans-cinnamate dioxygenase ferredoxin subunit
MADFVRVASKKEIPNGQGRMFDIEGRSVAVFNVAGTFYAIDNRCEHQQGPLADGDLDGCVVTCPWHGWTYDVSTGQSPDDAATRVATFALKLEGDDVWVALAEPAGAA